MPHATDPSDGQAAEDEALIQRVLDVDPENAVSIDLNRELEPGPKADNAVDYEDIGDDDLDEVEDMSQATFTQNQREDVVNGRLENAVPGENGSIRKDDDAGEDDFEDLFGDDEAPQSPPAPAQCEEDGSNTSLLTPRKSFEREPITADEHDEQPQPSLHRSLANESKIQSIRPLSLDALNAQKVSKEEQMQQYLISMSRQGPAPHDSFATNATNLNDDAQSQDLSVLWPRFERDSVPRFMDLLPYKKSHYIGKRPLKQPRPVHPTKLNLDLAADQEKQFRLISRQSRKSDVDDERNGIVRIYPIKLPDEESLSDASLPSDEEEEAVAGVTWQDLQVICEDWHSTGCEGSTVNDSSSDIGLEMHGRTSRNSPPDDQWHLPPAKVRRPELSVK